MARLLHSLGSFSARRAPYVIVVWVLILTGAILAGSLAGGKYSDQLSIPGTPSQELGDRLQSELPAAARGTGTVLFSNGDEPITDEQKDAIIEAMTAVGKVDGVYQAQDPYAVADTAQQQLDMLANASSQIESGRAELEAAAQQIESGQAEIDAGRAELEAGQEQIDAAREQIPDVPVDQLPPQAQAQIAELDAAQVELDANRQALEAAEQELNAGREEYEAGLAQLEQHSAQVDRGNRLAEVAGDYSVVSDNGHAAIGLVTFDESDLSISDATRQDLMAAVEGTDLKGLDVYYSQTIATEISSLFGASEAIGLAIAALVLVLMLRTFSASILPIVTGLAGVGVTVMVAQFAAGFIDMHSISPILGIMLGLAVGIDYTLFVVNRHREQMRRGYGVTESIALAIGTSGNAVVFAGLTVITALLALNVVGIPFLGILGNVAALAVFLAVSASVTLTPALLQVAGPRVLPKKERASIGRAEGPVSHSEHHQGKRDPFPVRHPWITGGISILLLGLLSIPAFSMRLGLPDGSSESPGTDAYEGYRITSEAFGPGRNGPLVVAATLPEGISDEESEELQLQIAEKLHATDEAEIVLPIGSEGSMAAYQIIETHGPTSVETEDYVHELRDSSPLEIDGNEVPIEVTGLTAMQIDISEKLGEALPIYLSVVVAISFVLLMIVFRSLLVPLIATAGFLLSLLSAMGAVVAVYQWGHFSAIFQTENNSSILSFLPILMIGILFGLAMDYQLFLATGMRESWSQGASARRAVSDGLYAGRKVVLAAAIIMFSVFAGFVFADLTMVRPIGFGLAIGVLLDAFVVRMALMPSLMAILGEKAWWLPRWLDKILPSVDVEGTSLVETEEESREDTDPVEDSEDTTEDGEPQPSGGKHSRSEADS